MGNSTSEFPTNSGPQQDWPKRKEKEKERKRRENPCTANPIEKERALKPEAALYGRQ